MRSISWLHFTDLHQGLDAQAWLWPRVREVLLADLEKLHGRCGPWDLILFSGDLTQRGSAAEFARLNQTLQQLWDHLRVLGSTPALVAVPGNHDLIRPPRRPESLVLGHWDTHPEVQDEFWRDASSPYRALVDQAFAPYSEWLKNHSFAGLQLQHGMLPGDCSAVLSKDGLKLGIVGLNSAFLQLGDGDYTGKLALDVRQLHAACGGDGPAWVKECDFALLMTHHPPSWLQAKARDDLLAEIAPPGRFVAHIYGHMHEHAGTVVAVGGAQARRELQGSSLFGLEVYDGKVDRRHGYTAARITVDDKNEVTLRLWPRVAKKHPAGHWRIVQDLDAFELDDDQGTRPEPLPPLRQPPSSSQIASSLRVPSGDISGAVHSATAGLSIPGMAVRSAPEHEDGSTRAEIALAWQLLAKPDKEAARTLFAKVLTRGSNSPEALLGMAVFHGMSVVSIAAPSWNSYLARARKEAVQRHAASEVLRAVALWWGLFNRFQEESDSDALGFLKSNFGPAGPFAQPVTHVVAYLEALRRPAGPGTSRGTRPIDGQSKRRPSLQGYVRLSKAMAAGDHIPASDPIWANLQERGVNALWSDAANAVSGDELKTLAQSRNFVGGRADLGIVRVSRFRGEVKVHVRTSNGWEPRPLDAEAERLILFAISTRKGRTSLYAESDANPLYRVDVQVSLGEVECRWSSHNDVGERLLIEAHTIPTAIRCDLLAACAALPDELP